MLPKLRPNPIFCAFLFFLSHQISSAQTFERVETISGFEILQENAGVAVADYDADNDLDIFVVAKAKDEAGVAKSHSRLFRNNNDGSFTDVTEEAGLTNLLPADESDAEDFFGLDGFKHGVSWGDYNNDGFPDLFFTHSYKVQFFRNLGNGQFIELTEAAGFDEVNECRNMGATWFDYNNDGYVDIYINDWDECDSNTLYKNNVDGTFTKVTQASGLQEVDSKASYTALPFDFDNNGFMDLFVTNDFDNKPNYVYLNQDGSSFVENAAAYGLESGFDDMAITVGDYNMDGFFDIFTTAIDKNNLFTNNGDNTFTDQSVAMNVDNTLWSWGATFADFDLDGDEDLFVVNGFDFQTRDVENNVFFKNLNAQGQNAFENASVETNLGDLTISVEALDFDYDNDGDLDLFVTNADRASFFYENKLLNFDQLNIAHWFKVQLQGTTSNRNAVGTELTLTTSTGSIKRYYTGVGFLGQSIQPVHFGLGQETTISQLTIKWPSGLEESYNNLAADTFIKAIEGQGYQVLNVQPSVKIYGCTDPNACSYNPSATLNDGSCEYLTSAEISGNTNSGFLSVETYTYPIGAGSSANWTVSGGELLSGQGTGEITVRWHLESSGMVTVVEIGAACSSLPIELQVNLSVNAIDDDKSIARIWNEALLEAIRGDFARPTVHARNLFHTSVAMYDAWAIYDEDARPYLIGNEVNGFSSELLDFIPTEPIEDSRRKAISYAAYRLLSHRFKDSPAAEESQARFDLIMEQLGYDIVFQTSTVYEFGNAAALGNYIAETIINYGMADGAREASAYDNAYYEPVNEPLAPNAPGNTTLTDANRWQPLSLETFIDQSGNVIGGVTPEFLSPEWGDVWSFAMSEEDTSTFQRDGDTYTVYNNPSEPPYLDDTGNSVSSEAYKWGFSLVSVWGSHLDPTDGVLWDISPKSIGNLNIESFPTDYTEHPNFYNLIDGGDIGEGRTINPITGNAYEEQIVPRGDYARVLAEFWADGPDSETPPGHWFTILNYVNDHPDFEKRFAGEGPILDPLEWNVKSYFILGGTMHDAAISAWSIKGWYDYIRPISAIRYMAEKGQSTDESLPNYDPEGIPLMDGFIEIVEPDDPLVNQDPANEGKIKLFTWRGHDYIDDTEVDQAGVGWILAENWWPYQRPTFVTPPFAGFVSGHSTYSRAAAEVMTMMTGSAYFPGGMGEFIAKKNEFLVFEEGPSQDVVLQWATYRDASDQCSLSRIWGGIHPPADDIPGRLIGEKVGVDAYDFAVPYFSGKSNPVNNEDSIIYPNPVFSDVVNVTNTKPTDVFRFFDIRGRLIEFRDKVHNEFTGTTTLSIPSTTATGIYILRINDSAKMVIVKD